MNNELLKTNKRYYEIQYTNSWDSPDVWYTSTSAGDGGSLHKSYVEACKKVRELIDSGNSTATEYRVVEHVVAATTEVLKNFPIYR